MKCSRRAFIKSAVWAAAGLGAAGWTLAADGRGCRHCGARMAAAHEFYDGRRGGAFCPNCGIEIKQMQFVMERSMSRFCRPARKSGPAGGWTFAQVPFPHSARVRHTGKPAGTLAQIRF